jgi:hypothetical protein
MQALIDAPRNSRGSGGSLRPEREQFLEPDVGKARWPRSWIW